MKQVTSEQYYTFEHDGQVMCEMFWDGNHVTAPTPWAGGHILEATAHLQRLHPHAIVDQLCYPADMDDALKYA